MIEFIGRSYRWLNGALEGAPDWILTGLLIGCAIGALTVAWKGTPMQKLGVLFWMLLP